MPPTAWCCGCVSTRSSRWSRARPGCARRSTPNPRQRGGVAGARRLARSPQRGADPILLGVLATAIGRRCSDYAATRGARGSHEDALVHPRDPGPSRADHGQPGARAGRGPGSIRAPTEWQLCLGVLRLWHRVVFRSGTVGTSSSGAVRATWRARILAWRALRLPFLLGERRRDAARLTGLASPPEQIMRHLIGAHHDHNQFVYDLELLRLLRQARAAA